jgi:hypothetical protein
MQPLTQHAAPVTSVDQSLSYPAFMRSAESNEGYNLPFFDDWDSINFDSLFGADLLFEKDQVPDFAY